MHKFLKKVHAQARKSPKRIVFPEGTEERILKATEAILKKKFAHPILIGNPSTIKRRSKKLELEIDWKKIEIIDHKRSKLLPEFTEELYKLRKHKGWKREKCAEKLQDFNYFATMFLHLGHADGMVTGTTFSTAESIRPALQIIKTKEKFHKVSGVFFMALENKTLLFADTAITVEPNSHDLADIAIDTAETALSFGIKPRIAMLSFSTNSSAKHPKIDKIQEAVSMLKYERPDLIVDGEIQVDAALVPGVAQKKCPKSPLKGNSNILIFPNLESANIAYKLVERLAKAKAIGPLLQGLKKPVNDLSRGCSYQDIVHVTAFTVCECQQEHQNPQITHS